MSNCYLCGEKTHTRRGFFIPTLLGWKHRREYICRTCYTYWTKETKAAIQRKERFC
jgi:hypothetical protein